MMTKDEFFKMLDLEFEKLSPEDVSRKLDEMQVLWLNEYRDKRFENFEQCGGCYHFISKNDFIIEIEMENREVKMGDKGVLVEMQILYYICPKCGAKREINKTTTKFLKFI